ncbi:MAG TPA: alpha-2-macroglobulin [Peptococcaceae bacterium]|nr:alpha-2-macroglobulin [Peptococcaceae bacterium]
MGELVLNPEPVRASGISIKALDADSLGISPETAFLLSSEEPLPEKTVKEALRTEPQFAYELEKLNGGRQYKIIPKEKLTSNKIYTLAFDPEGKGQENLSWAFQTKSQFKVLRTLPANESTYVPVDTGIEVTFTHENYDFNKIANYFSIQPEVKGRFEQHKKTLVFVPEELKPSTIYTVTLKKGFLLAGSSETLQEDYVFSFETAPAEESKPAFNFDMDTSLTEFSPADVPAFPVYFYYEYAKGVNSETIPSLQIDLYRYPDHRAFQASLAKRDKIPRWAYLAWNNYREELPAEYKTAQYQTEFLQTDRYSHYIIFPEELAPGYYAAEFKAGDCLRQVWFQVTDLAVYLAQGEESTIFWAHDLKTKKPVGNMQVIIPSRNISVQGDQNGVVLLQEQLMGKERDYALVKSEAGETLVPLEARPYWQPTNLAINYWKYLYLDRELYQPEDTLHYWGVLAERSQGTPSGKEEVTLELMGSGGPYYEGAEISPILTQRVTVRNKTFNGEMKLPVLKPGYYYLQLKTGDTVLLSRGFEVQTYHKPAYRISLTQDKKAVFMEEKVNFELQAAFFEGTPVRDLTLNYNLEGSTGKLTTNEEGKATLPYTPIAGGDEYQSYLNVYLNVTANLPEAGEIYDFAQLYVFKSKVFLTGEAKRQRDSYTLTGKLSTVDLTKINQGEYLTEKNFLQDPVVNSPVKAVLYQEEWIPVEAGERYDFISKKKVKDYRYEYSSKQVGTFELLTDAEGHLNYTGKIDPEYSYYLDLIAQDSDGREFKKRIYLGGGSNYPDYRHFYLQTDKGGEGYSPGEKVEVTMMVNDRELAELGQTILFYRGQKFIDSYEVSSASKYNFTFESGHIPNLTVGGVYFDGSHYMEANTVTVPFARETKALAVKIETDKTEYRPGEKVRLELQVTDPKEQPVSGAQVNLNLVDEALFALRDQRVNFLDSLYGDYYYLFLQTRKSHDNIGSPGGAEKGGEGGSERQDFRDTVLFTTVTTDKDGKARAEFELPDNLTSWRVTYHAVTQDLQAGSGTAQIPVRLPFFINLTLNKTYLEGDSPVVILRSYGEKLKEGQPVSYMVKLAGVGAGDNNTEGQAEEKTWEVSGTAFKPLDVKLPALKAGSYRLTVAGVSGGLTDSLALEFQVAKSFQQRTVTTQDVLTSDFVVQGSPLEPTTVIFSDYEKSQYLRGLYQLAGSNGSRLEQKLAAMEARKLLKEYFLEENIFGEDDEQESLLVYQQHDGGISILPYGESELALSAMVASGTKGIFDERALIGYFYSILEAQEQGEDRSLALLGLAALKEPVLLQINEYLRNEGLEPSVKINLALALLEIGDGAYAQKIAQELLSQYAEDLGSVLRINVGRDQDEIIAATTQMALLASRLDLSEKHKLYQYLLENPGQEILNLVEQIQILKANLKYMQSSPVSFNYELNGQKVTKTLQAGEIFELTLLPEELNKIKFSGVEGKVGVMSKYSLPIKAGEQGKAEDLAISRSYVVNKTVTNSIGRSDLVQVTLTFNIGDKAPAGLYEIIDVLPAGLVHIPRPYNYSGQKEPYGSMNWSYPTEVNGQRLVFLVSKGETKLTYLARVISPGEFRCEAPVLSNIKNNAVYTSGKEDRISIE